MALRFRERKREISFQRRGGGAPVLSAMRINNGLGVISELIATLHTAQLPPDAKREGLLMVFTSLSELLEEATYIDDLLPPVYNENRGRGLNTFDNELCVRELRFGKSELLKSTKRRLCPTLEINKKSRQLI